MILPKGIEDLVYVVQKDKYDGHLYAGFSTKSIQEMDGQNTWCSPSHSALGSLHRWSTNKDISDYALRPKRFGVYKYTLTPVQSACSDKQEVLDMQVEQGKLLEEAYTTISQLEQ